MSTSGEELVARRLEASERARVAGLRMARLDKGEPPTEADVVEASAAANVALKRSARAHDAAADVHRHAAERHREVAQVLKEAGKHERSVAHLKAADSDDDRARADDQAGAVDRARAVEDKSKPRY